MCASLLMKDAETERQRGEGKRAGAGWGKGPRAKLLNHYQRQQQDTINRRLAQLLFAETVGRLEPVEFSSVPLIPILSFNIYNQNSSSMASLESSDPEIDTVHVLAAKDLINSGYRYLDVRTEEEFNRSHLDVHNPLNVPYMFNTPQGRVKNPKFMEEVLSVCSKDDKLIVGCQTGVRSVYATTDLLHADFKHVKNMGGGYVAWMQNGLPVTEPESEKAEL
ncbi:hypothetical protein Ancab_026606 [Ancistrocladus abbreviatus]